VAKPLLPIGKAAILLVEILNLLCKELVSILLWQMLDEYDICIH